MATTGDTHYGARTCMRSWCPYSLRRHLPWLELYTYYGDTHYGDTNYGDTNYGDTHYGARTCIRSGCPYSL